MILLLSVLPQDADIVVDTMVQKPISPFIYGANHPFEANHPNWSAFAKTFTVARRGGNCMTAYNWETNASNAGSDYRHQNDGYMGESNEPGKTVSDFIKSAAANGSVTILTVPAAGYVSADKGPGGDVNETPDYINKRFHRSLASKPGGKYLLSPDTSDKAVYQDEFVNWVERTRYPKHAVWYSVDNEPDLWQSTHERIVPQNVGYAGILKITRSSKGYLANPANPYAPSVLATKISGSGVPFKLPAYGVGTVELN